MGKSWSISIYPDAEWVFINNFLCMKILNWEAILWDWKEKFLNKFCTKNYNLKKDTNPFEITKLINEIEQLNERKINESLRMLRDWRRWLIMQCKDHDTIEIINKHIQNLIDKLPIVWKI